MRTRLLLCKTGTMQAYKVKHTCTLIQYEQHRMKWSGLGLFKHLSHNIAAAPFCHGNLTRELNTDPIPLCHTSHTWPPPPSSWSFADFSRSTKLCPIRACSSLYALCCIIFAAGRASSGLPYVFVCVCVFIVRALCTCTSCDIICTHSASDAHCLLVWVPFHSYHSCNHFSKQGAYCIPYCIPHQPTHTPFAVMYISSSDIEYHIVMHNSSSDLEYSPITLSQVTARV